MGHNSPSGLYVLGRQRTRTAKKVCVVAGTSTSKMVLAAFLFTGRPTICVWLAGGAMPGNF